MNAKRFLCFLLFLAGVFMTLPGVNGQTVSYNTPSFNTSTYQMDPGDVSDLKALLDSFFRTKNSNVDFNTFWDSSEYARYQYPFMELYYAEYSQYYNEEYYYNPLVLSFEKIIGTGYLIKIAFVGVDSLRNPLIKSIYNLQAAKNATGGFRLKRATDYFVRNWQVHQIGTIRYFVNPNRKFDEVKARQFDSINYAYAQIFEFEPSLVQYYLCENAKQLFNVKGYDFLLNMYLDTMGGMVEAGSPIIYAGNNSELYPHELVHVYLNQKFLRCNYIVAEGLPSYLGGSADVTLDQHLANLKVWVVENKVLDMEGLLNQNQEIGNHTSTYYTLSGLVCKLIIEKKGYNAIFKLAEVPDDEAVAEICKVLEVEESEFTAFLLAQVMKY